MAYADIALRANAALMRHFGVDAVHGTDSAQVILEQPTIADLSGAALDQDYIAVMSVDDLPALAMGETITINGTTYTVREVYLSSDGVTKRVGLSA